MNARTAGILVAFATLGLAHAAQAQYPSSPTRAASVPAGFTPCAVDGGTCRVTPGATVTVYYGAKTTFAVLTGRGDFVCLPNTFSIGDPVPNVQKTCYTNATLAAAPAAPSTPAAASRWPSVAACANDALAQTEVTKSYIALKDAYVKALAGINMNLPQSASALEGVARGVTAVNADPRMTMQKCTDYNDSIVSQRNAWAGVVAGAGRVAANQGKTPACTGPKALVYCLPAADQTTLLTLTSYADPGTVTATMDQALEIAVYWGNAALTKILLDRGANVNAVSQGASPLMVAAGNAGPWTQPFTGPDPTGNGANYLATVQLLVARGANFRLTLKDGKTQAVDYAAQALKTFSTRQPGNAALSKNLTAIVDFLIAENNKPR